MLKSTRRTNSDDTETHRDGVLDGKMAKSSTRTGEDDPVADVSVRVLDRTVYGDALDRTIE